MKTTEPKPRRAARKKPPALPVFATLGVLFAMTFGFLTLGLAKGEDPVLGKKALATIHPERPVVVIRKVIRRKVVTTVVPADPVTTAAGYSGGTSYPSSGTTYAAPVTSTAAPAPAPVVSSAS